jgi:hypothetical protein
LSLDLYEREVAGRREAAPKTSLPESSVWDGFARGTGTSAMQTFAKAGRAASMALAPAAMAVDAFGDGTEMQDRFFRWHDDVFGEAVNHWTPAPGEVGVAGQITGQLLATLPMVIAAPSAAVAATGLGTAEDLVRKGVDPAPAVATGVVQAAGLGLGIYVPILGQTLAQRVLLGGAGFNVFQGAATRAASEVILEGTKAEGDFKAFDPTALTLDVLLGSAFGAIAHVSPSARAQGAQFYERISAWSKSLKPSDVDGLLVMRQAQHLNADSLPGRPVSPEDMGNHAARTRRAIEQLARDKPVDVSDLPAGKFEADEPRLTEMAARANDMVRAAEEVRKAEGLPSVPETEAPPARVSAEPPPPRGEGERPGGAEAKGEGEPPAPEVIEARRFADERGDLDITVGRDADGNPIKMKLKKMLDDSDREVKLAQEDAKLFEVAAACMLGGA